MAAVRVPRDPLVSLSPSLVATDVVVEVVVKSGKPSELVALPWLVLTEVISVVGMAIGLVVVPPSSLFVEIDSVVDN